MKPGILKLIPFNLVILLLGYIFLCYNGDPPDGFTGAPGQGTCMASGCHTGGTFGGNVVISGLPSVINSNQAYNITVTLNNTSGNAFKGGFQLVALNSTNNSVGELIALDSDHGVSTTGGKEYVDHRGGKPFIGNSASWTFQWIAPGAPNGEVIKMYASGNFTNGSNSVEGDNSKQTFVMGTLMSVVTPVEVTVVHTNVTCFGFGNGTATANGSGGTPPYTYLWNTNSTNNEIDNLVPGIYKVTVTDANSQTATGQTTITQPSNIQLNVNDGTLTCLNTSVVINSTVSGGVGPFEYLWSTAETSSSIEVNAPGQYVLEVTDANGCAKSKTSTITQVVDPPVITIDTPGMVGCATPTIQLNATCTPDCQYLWTTSNGHIVSGNTTLNPTIDKAGVYKLKATNPLNGCIAVDSVEVFEFPPIQGNIAITNIACNGDSTGQLIAYISGGEQPYEYMWSTGESSQVIDSLKAGTYSLTVLDNAGCNKIFSSEVIEPEKLSVIINNTGISGPGKSDGTALVVPDGGSSPYTFLWNTGDTTQLIDSLPVGLYSVTVTDSLGCITKQSTNINPYNCTLNVGSVTSAVKCFGGSDGSICTIVSGGTKPYNYKWDIPGSDSCLYNLKAGVYSLTVSDLAGCVEIKQIQITQPTEIAILPGDITITGETGKGFSDGTAVVKASGGTGPYLYNFDNGSVNPGLNLKSGKHFVTVTDANGCTKKFEFIVPVYPCDSLGIKFVNFNFDYGCVGDPLKICVNTVIGGKTPYTYLWGNGSSESCATDFISNINVITITDAKNCPGKFFINDPGADTIKATFKVTGIIEGVSSGSIEITTVKGGSLPYTYSWTGPDGFTSSQKDIISEKPGVYCVVITDSKGCTNTFCVDLTTVGTKSLTQAGWKLFPNPARDYIYLQKNNYPGSQIYWQVFDAKGRQVLYKEEDNLKGKITIPLSQLSSGSYYIILNENGINYSGKFIVR